MSETAINKKLKEERLQDLRRMRALAKENKDKSKEVPPESLPKPIDEIMGTPQEEVVRIHARQARQHQIQICDVEGCYAPLNPVRDPANDNNPRVVTEEMEGEQIKIGVLGLCSWAGKVHGEQVIKPPPPKEDL
jgi:hypothetical protein